MAIRLSRKLISNYKGKNGKVRFYELLGGSWYSNGAFLVNRNVLKNPREGKGSVDDLKRWVRGLAEKGNGFLLDEYTAGLAAEDGRRTLYDLERAAEAVLLDVGWRLDGRGGTVPNFTRRVPKGEVVERTKYYDFPYVKPFRVIPADQVSLTLEESGWKPWRGRR